VEAKEKKKNALLFFVALERAGERERNKNKKV